MQTRAAHLTILVVLASACRQSCGGTDLGFADGGGGGLTQATQGTGALDTSGGGTTSESDPTTTSANGSTSISSSVDASSSAEMSSSADASSSSGLPVGCFDLCRDTFDGLAACLQDTGEANLAASALTGPTTHALRLVPASGSGFWDDPPTLGARLHFVDVPGDTPFVAVTRVRVTFPFDGIWGEEDRWKTAGLLVRVPGAQPTDVGWLTMVSGSLFDGTSFGARGAQNKPGAGGAVVKDDMTTLNDVQGGITLGVCRYTTGDLHTFYKTMGMTTWQKGKLTIEVSPLNENGPLEVGVHAAAFVVDDAVAELDGVVVRACVQTILGNDDDCREELDIAEQGL